MSDLSERTLTRDSSLGDELARARLGAERARRGLCPWCAVPQDAERNEGCCCAACFDREQVEGRRAAASMCAGCPLAGREDEES